MKAVAKNWISRKKVQGFVSAIQPSSFQDTQVNIGLDELERGAALLSVHVAPVEQNLIIPCTEESLGG